MIESPPATMQDIADRVGMHRSTVALALRDSPRISAETREMIKAIAKESGYRVNPLVSALMKARRNGCKVRHAVLAFVTSHSTRFGWRTQGASQSDYFFGAFECAKKFGYTLEHFWLTEPGMTPARLSQILTTRGIHGLIVGEMPPGQDALDLSWKHFSSVALGTSLRSPRLHHVAENYFDTARQVLDACRMRGYRRIGFVDSSVGENARTVEHWLAMELVQRAKFSAVERLTRCPGAPADEVIFREWLTRERPDVLVVTEAEPVMRWLGRTKAGAAPTDLGLVELRESANSEVTGVYCDRAKIGALAVEMLVGLLHHNETGIPLEQRGMTLAGVWREGKTLPRRTPHLVVDRQTLAQENMTTCLADHG